MHTRQEHAQLFTTTWYRYTCSDITTNHNTCDGRRPKNRSRLDTACTSYHERNVNETQVVATFRWNETDKCKDSLVAAEARRWIERNLAHDEDILDEEDVETVSCSLWLTTVFRITPRNRRDYNVNTKTAATMSVQRSCPVQRQNNDA